MCAGWGIFCLGLKEERIKVVEYYLSLFGLLWCDLWLLMGYALWVMWWKFVTIDLVSIYGYWCVASLWLLVWWKFDHRGMMEVWSQRINGSLNAENRLVEWTCEWMLIGFWWVEWADDVTNFRHEVESVRLTLCDEGMRFGLKLKILKGLTLDDVRCQVENTDGGFGSMFTGQDVKTISLGE